MKKPVRRYEDTAANWLALNPILPAGWEGVESDTGREKAGDGLTAFNSLAYKNLAGTAAVFDIRDYGARVDGVTDDRLAIKAAITAAKTAKGGTIYFPPGTTRIGAGGVDYVDFNPGGGSIIFTGEGSKSKVLLNQLGGAYAFGILNASSVTFRDFAIVGETSGTASSVNYESTYPWIYIGTAWNAVFERMLFFGLSTSSTDGGIHSATSNTVFRDCYFAACTAPNGGVIQTNNNYMLGVDGCEFWDIVTFNGVTYSKPSVVAATKNWIRHINPAALVHGIAPASYIKNCKFDEARSEAHIYALGTALTMLDIENCELAGGLIDVNLPCVSLDTFAKVTIKNMWAGYNALSWPSIIAANVAALDIDGLIHANGATDIRLTGTTKRLRLRNSQGVTITNTAAAFVDADQAMPSTPSAAALSPLGKVTHVTGAVNITSITTTNLKAGDEITLIFDSTPTLTDGNNIKAAGNLVATADDSWTGVYDGTNVIEKSRSVN